MPIESNSEPTSQPGDEPLTPLQEAIRARAIATLENADRQPEPSMRRKLWTGVLAVVTVVLLVVAIDFAVRIIQRILALYGQEETTVPAPASADPNQPFYITVDPPAEAPDSKASASSADTGRAAE